jgi:hypothetical protein
MPTIGAFVEALAKDGTLSSKFERLPRRTMKEFGLTPAQMDKIMHGSIKALRTQIEADLSPKKPLVFRVKRG